MAKLKLGAIADDKPVKLTIELPAAVHRDLVAYADALARETGQAVSEPAKLIAPLSGNEACNGQLCAACFPRVRHMHGHEILKNADLDPIP